MKIHSRGAIRARVMRTTNRMIPKSGLPLFGQRSCANKEGVERRKTHPAMAAPSFPSLSLRKVSGGGSAAILAGIARLPALHGGACPDERTSGLSPGRASREIKETRRRYPRRHSRLSGAPRTPIVMPEGTMPGPPGSGVTNPARGNRTRSVSRCVSRPRPSRARFPGDYLPVDKYSQAWQYAPTLRPQGEKPCHGNRNQSRK